jgi:hypothetical protein
MESHSCGSTSQTIQVTVEEAIYEAAPDLTSLVVEGLEEPADSGFISVEKLLGSAPHGATPLSNSSTLHSLYRSEAKA